MAEPINKGREREFKASIRHMTSAEQRVALDAWRKEQLDEAPAAAAPTPITPQNAPQSPTSPDEFAYAPAGPLTVVPCTLPGWEKVRVSMDLSARWEAVFGVPDNSDGFGILRRAMVLCPLIEWHIVSRLNNEPYPDCKAPDLESYKILIRRGEPVLDWIFADGIKTALESRLGGS